MGRLHLSVMGNAEPQRDKLQRPASFSCFKENDNRTARARAVPVEVLIDEEKDIFAHP